jgi:FkbM family methyltransferase
VLSRIGEIVKEPVVIEVKEFDGVFSIDPRSHLLRRILANGYYEPRISQLYCDHIRPDGDILDIGANVGFFTVGGARRLTTGRLLAAEPTSGAFTHLKKNVERNGVSERVILFKGMVGLERGQGQIHFIPGYEEYSSADIPEHFAMKNQTCLSETVPIERVDDLVERYSLRPTLMKVDVEGAEFSVFAGAQATLATFRPVVISELWRGPTRADGHRGIEIVRMLEQLGYVVLDPTDPRATPGSQEMGEILCIPKERYESSLLRS